MFCQVHVAEEIEELGRIKRERVSNLRKTCKVLKKKGKVRSSSSLPRKNLQTIIVDDHYKVLLCYIPKVACTNLKRVFLILSGKMNTTNPLDLQSGDVHGAYDRYLRYLDDYTESEIQEKIRTYKKMIFVREPFERLLSAYRNKFLDKGDYFRSRFGKRIIKKYRKNATAAERQSGKGVRFSEFVQYLIDPKTLREDGFNEHWAHYYALCHPCSIEYDFIGKYETIDDDVNFVLKDLAVDKIIKFPDRSDTYRKKKTVDMMSKFYQELSPSNLKRLWTLYVNDYKLFDYPYPQIMTELLPQLQEEGYF